MVTVFGPASLLLRCPTLSSFSGCSCLQLLAVPSPEAANTDDSSAEATADATTALSSNKVCTQSPVEVLQILSVLSTEAVNTADPPAESTADVTTAFCSDKVCAHSQVEAFRPWPSCRTKPSTPTICPLTPLPMPQRHLFR